VECRAFLGGHRELEEGRGRGVAGAMGRSKFEPAASRAGSRCAGERAL
jgi:hypothetical protein